MDTWFQKSISYINNTLFVVGKKDKSWVKKEGGILCVRAGGGTFSFLDRSIKHKKSDDDDGEKRNSGYSLALFKKWREELEKNWSALRKWPRREDQVG